MRGHDLLQAPQKEDHIASRLLSTLCVRLGLIFVAMIVVSFYVQDRRTKLGITNGSTVLNSMSDPPYLPLPDDSDKKSFVFLKTHKTGSSTVTALILRKCMNERLNCFIPKSERPGKTFDLRKDYMEITNGRGELVYVCAYSCMPILLSYYA
jgi:hypothetical protein